jgi:multidrug efflux pump subunit AcrA (membrane-fusion protein)
LINGGEEEFVMRWRWWHAAFPILAALTGCSSHGGAAGSDEEHAEKTEAHVTVRAEPARSGVMTVTVDALGRCDALPDRIATLTPAVEGHVHDLLVSQGEVVKKGQPIVEFNREVAEADLAEKTASRDALKASLVLLQSLPRPAERRANELAVETAKVAVEQTRANADRLRALLSHHESSEQQVVDAERLAKQAVIQQATAEATLRAMMIGPRPEAVAEAQSKIKTAEGLVAFSKAHLDFHTIRAPIDGVLDSLTCHPGQTIAIGAPIGEVVDTRQVFASVWIPTHSASLVKVGQPARVRPADATYHAATTAEHDKKEGASAAEHDKKEGASTAEHDKKEGASTAEHDKKEGASTAEHDKTEGASAAEHDKKEAASTAEHDKNEMAGKVAFVGRVSDPQTGNLPIRIVVDNPEGQLTIGESIHVAIVIEEQKSALQVPAVAILDLGEGPVLSVVRDGKTAILHPEVGASHDGWTAVSGTDLKEGEPVIVEGGYNLPAETPVLLAGASEKEAAEAHADGEKAASKAHEPDEKATAKAHEADEKASPKAHEADEKAVPKAHGSGEKATAEAHS